MTILDTPGKRLRALRHDLGMTQIELGKRINKDHSYISLIENDNAPGVSAAIMADIAQILESSVDYIMGLSSNPLPPPEATGDELPADERILHEAIERLPLAIRDQTVQYFIQETERIRRLVQMGRKLGEQEVKYPPR